MGACTDQAANLPLVQGAHVGRVNDSAEVAMFNFWRRNRPSKHSTGGSGETQSTDGESGSPFAGAWEGPWEGAGARWLYPMGGRAWLQIAADGTLVHVGS